MDFAMRETGIAAARMQYLLHAYTGTITEGIALLAPYDLRDKRVLEVGAGIGALTFYLRQRGVDAIALEPGGIGFDEVADVGQALRSWLGESATSIIDVPVERLSPEIQGKFDLIFSVNVVEHLPDLDAAFASMAAVLAPNGRMVHTCPNYSVPYEPHYGIPLLPFVPSRSAWLLPRGAKRDIWNSVNFVTYRQIKDICRRADLRVSFRRGTLHDAFMRLERDPDYALRHGGLVTTLGQILFHSGALALLRHVPPALATPMEFECTRADAVHSKI